MKCVVSCALVVLALFTSPSARAQERRRSFSGELTASSGYAWFTTIGSAATIGFGGALRWKAARMSLSYDWAEGLRGDARIIAAQLGLVIPLSPFELDVLGVFGQHSYSDVGGLHTDDPLGVREATRLCVGYSGVGADRAFIGAALDLHAERWSGTHFHWALSLWFGRDLSSGHVARPTCYPLTTESDVGGNAVGLALRFGFEAS